MELYYFLSVIIVASVLQGITGFGSALIAAPLLLLVLDKTTSVISLSFVSIALNAFLFIAIKYPLDKKTLYRIILPSLLGLPFGIFVLRHLDISILRILAGLLSIVFAVLLFGKSFQIKRTRLVRMLSGFFSGVLHTSIGVSGPPVVLLLARENTEKNEMRRTLALLFFIMSVASIILFFFTKDLTQKAINFGIYGIPAAFLGAYIGNLISKKVSQKQFILSVFILISITIIVALYSGFKGWFMN